MRRRACAASPTACSAVWRPRRSSSRSWSRSPPSTAAIFPPGSTARAASPRTTRRRPSSSIHGGPEAQERVEYSAFYQYLLARGIGVLAPNIRGSTGYGVAYQKLIHRDWGGAELRDIEAAAQYLGALPWVSEQRIGVYGGSFGGFATLSAVTRLPDYWTAAVDIVGPSDLITFVRSVPPTWRRMMSVWVGDPETDAEFLRERSPITHVENVRAPLLVLQGANDPRVVKAESDQMVGAAAPHGPRRGVRRLRRRGPRLRQARQPAARLLAGRRILREAPARPPSRAPSQRRVTSIQRKRGLHPSRMEAVS